jgi:DNA-binding IclR family transcriptional regulator
MATTDNPERRIKTTDRVFDIIETVREERGCTLAALSEGISLGKSTIYHHLRTLEELGYLVRDGDEYRLSLRFLDLGLFVKNHHPLGNIAHQTLQALAEETGETAWVMVEEQGHSYLLEVAKGENAVQTVERSGLRSRLHFTSGGKVILAHLPPEKTDQIIAAGLPPATDETITDVDKLQQELAAIRRLGYGFMDGEGVKGLRGVSAPIFSDGQVLGAVTVAGPAKRLRSEYIRGDLVEDVLAAANTIELQVEYS